MLLALTHPTSVAKEDHFDSGKGDSFRKTFMLEILWAAFLEGGYCRAESPKKNYCTTMEAFNNPVEKGREEPWAAQVQHPRGSGSGMGSLSRRVLPLLCRGVDGP